jgi:DNA helicase-2/ATP-dependent DNA helicase PcrA
MLLEAIASWACRREAAGIELRDILGSLRGIAPEARDHEAMAVVIRGMLDADGSAPARDLVELITETVLRSHTTDPGAGEDARELERMRAGLAPGGKQEDMTLSGLGDRARAPGHVMAATIHAAKGLEFDVVILVGADEGGLPGFECNDEQMAEGRRKFYVSITRARRDVHLIYTDNRISRAGRPYSVRPCPFIAELGL